MKPSIYFIAIIPDAATCAEVKAFKEFALANFESGGALKSPAHITLEPPFKWPDEDYPFLEKTLQSFAEKQSGFSLSLNNFEAFPPKVIFIDLIKSDPLFSLQDDLKNYLKSELKLVSDRPNRTYHPHMTIAFKDLRKSMFSKAWEHFSKVKYQKQFTVDWICLLKHNGKIWEEIFSAKFGA